MPYIGKEPTIGNFVKLDAISTSSTNTYNLTLDSVAFTPESALHMLVSLNGIIQSPLTSFSVSGSTITFLPSSGTLSSSDSIDFIMVYGNVLDIGTPSDSTVTNAKTNFVSTSSSAGLQIKGDGTTDGTLQLNCSQNSHGIKLKSPPHSAGQSYTLTFPSTAPATDKILQTNSSGVLSFVDAGGGITQADGYRLSADANSGTGATVSTNWERIDDASFGRIGTGVTQSSGIFSFPETGIYQVFFQGRIAQNGSDAVCNLVASVTQNNSDYDEVAIVRMENPGEEESGLATMFFVDVTDISNVKFLIKTTSFSSGTVLRGDTDYTYTGVFVIRLGDT